VDSILSQDYPNIECIVVDAQSRDGTLDILAAYADKIRWISRPDRGPFDAINEGWQLGRGSILAWLNADDLLAEGSVSAAVRTFCERGDADVVYGTCGLIDSEGAFKFDLVPAEWDLRNAVLYCDHIIFQPASFMRRSILEHAGWLYPAWNHDHDLWLRLSVAGARFVRIPDRLAFARDHDSNAGFMPELFVDGKVGLTRRFFHSPNLPREFYGLERRAISNAYIRCWDYLDQRNASHWLIAAKLGARALVVDPMNAGEVVRRGLTTAAQHAPVLPGLMRLTGRAFASAAAWRRRLVVLAAGALIAVGAISTAGAVRRLLRRVRGQV
jgi:glycosyltransferase involved in cell wall biosynthesis